MDRHPVCSSPLTWRQLRLRLTDILPTTVYPWGSTILYPSDENINLSGSICGTQWLCLASLLLKHKLILQVNPQSVNHSPSTCSPYICLLFSPLTSHFVSDLLPSSCPPWLSADLHLHPHECVYQGCQTCGPWAGSGPRKGLIRPERRLCKVWKWTAIFQ